MKDKILFGGVLFDKRVFDFCLVSFKDAFSRSSVSIENAFNEFNNTQSKLDGQKDVEMAKIYEKLPNKEEINLCLHKMICFLGKKYGMYQDDIRQMNDLEVEQLYNKYFKTNEKDKYPLRFDEDLPFFIKLNEDGSLNTIETFDNIKWLFPVEFERRDGKKKAEEMQKDNLDAFDYARTLRKENRLLTIKDIININAKVVKSDPDRVYGFKKTNNIIIGAEFNTGNKENIPVLMSELLYDYQNNFGKGPLKSFDEPGITTEERNNRMIEYFIREAKFHIRFEKIHPFNDGNGRTGRIIMNCNLMSNDLVPVVITQFDSKKYRQFIGQNDYESLADFMLSSSAQLFQTWVSTQKTGLIPQEKALKVSNDSLSEVDDVVSIEVKKLVK